MHIQSVNQAASSLASVLSYRDRWDDLVTSVLESDSKGGSLGGEAARLYLDTGDDKGIRDLYTFAQGDYTLAKDGQDKEKTTAVGKAWKPVSDSIRSCLRRGGYSIHFDTLPKCHDKGEGECWIKPRAEAEADKREAEREANLKREAVRKAAIDKQQSEHAAIMASMSSRDIADSIRNAINLSGTSIPDLVIALLNEDGEAVRMIGSWLAGWESLAEKTAKAEAEAEAEAAKAEAAKAKQAARQAARQAAKAKQAEAEAA